MSIRHLNNAEQVRQFVQTIRSGKSVSVKATGEWTKAGAWQRFVEWLSGKEKNLQKITNIFSQQLDRLERKAVKFNCSEAELGEQQALYRSWMEGVTLIDDQFKLQKRVSKVTEAALTKLQMRAVGLQYRIEGVNGGFDQKAVGDRQLKEQLRTALFRWKKSEPKYCSEGLTRFDLDKIEEIAQYPQFVPLILKDQKLRELFFKWGIRDNNDIRPFIQYPAIYQRIYRSLLTGRMGVRVSEEMLAIRKIERKKEGSCGTRKVLQFMFDGKSMSLLNESKKVTLKNRINPNNPGWETTVGGVLDEAAAKNDRPGRIEVFEKIGFANWNVHEWGSWNGKGYDNIDLDQPNWWEKLPVQETLSKEDFEKRYGLEPLKEGEWVGFAKASRMTTDLDVDETHGYLGVAIPQPNGRYRLYDFGKFAERFPAGSKDRVLFIGDTLYSKISYPDENYSYGQRQIAAKPFILDPAKGLKLMEIVTDYAKRARERNLIFQFAWENCAFWPQEVFRRLFGAEMPNLYKAKIIDATPSNKILRVYFKVMKKMPSWIQWGMVRFIEFMLKGWRGVTVTENGKKVKKSVWRSPFHNNMHAFLPALLHEKILKGEVDGKIFFGHQSKVPGRAA